MADLIFEDSRLVAIYDAFDPDRKDLAPYMQRIESLGAKSVIDVGCGTGCLSILLAKAGYKVVGIDPAKASLDVAKKKPFANSVHWIVGDASVLPPSLGFDLALMTGNVAQVFTTDESWLRTLKCVRSALDPDGYFIFEARDPAKKAWLNWTREKTFQRVHAEEIGWVQGWCDVMNVSGDLVSFRWTYLFEDSDEMLSSDSVLRFRGRPEIENSLCEAGFAVKEVCDAPDRPGMEFVFIARVDHN